MTHRQRARKRLSLLLNVVLAARPPTPLRPSPPRWQALHYVHGKRILHRDLKTQNIFISKNLVKLGDFGIAKVMEGSMTAASTVIGTPYYMSPEVCQGQHYDYKSDVWALGCILYEICALQQAWSGSNLLGLVYKIVQEKQPRLPDNYSEELK